MENKTTPHPIKSSMISEDAMRWLVRATKIAALAAIVALLGVLIYWLAILPISYSQDYRNISNNIGIAGMAFSFMPLLGLLIKYSLALIKKMKWLEPTNPVILFSKDILKWERQTRLALAGIAIMLISSHLTVWGSYIDSGFRQWDFRNVIGLTCYCMLIVMNLNGVIMTIMRGRKMHMDKIKYLGYTNLVLGLTFLLLTILHITINFQF